MTFIKFFIAVLVIGGFAGAPASLLKVTEVGQSEVLTGMTSFNTKVFYNGIETYHIGEKDSIVVKTWYGQYLGFTSSLNIKSVIIRTADGSWLYDYRDQRGTYQDGILRGPDAGDGSISQIKVVSFYY